MYRQHLLLPLLALAACTGGPQGADTPTKILGSAQKGPFSIGSAVQLSLLDAHGDPTGMVFNSTTRSDLGDFELKLPRTGPAEIQTTGYYFNEIAGTLSTSQITLRAVVELSDAPEQSVYVNALTQLGYLRAKKLIAGGTGFREAVQQAESELAAALPLHRPTAAKAGSSLNLLGDDTDDNAYLFALSCLLGQAASLEESGSLDGNLQEIVSVIALDLESDGVLGAANLERLSHAKDLLDASGCTAHFGKWLAERGVATAPPQIDRALDWDGDGISDLDDHDDDGDQVLDTDDKVLSISETLAIDVSGQVWTLGSPPRPVSLMGTAGQPKQLAVSAAGTTALLLDDGSVWSLSESAPPTLVSGLAHIVSVWSQMIGGNSPILAIDQNGNGWSFDNTHPPEPITGVSDLKAVVGLPEARLTLLKNDGSVWNKGSPACGTNAPHAIPGLSGVVALGGDGSINAPFTALAADGTVWRWPYARCPGGDEIPSYIPESILTGVQRLSNDGQVAVKADGTVWLLGSVSGTAPKQVAGVTGAVAASPGYFLFKTEVFVLLGDGSVVVAGPDGIRTLRIPR